MSDSEKNFVGDPEWWWITVLPAGAMFLSVVFGLSYLTGVVAAGGNIGLPSPQNFAQVAIKLVSGARLDVAWLTTTNAERISAEVWLWCWAGLYATIFGGTVWGVLEWRASGYQTPDFGELRWNRAKGKFGRPPKSYRLKKWPIKGPYDWEQPSPGVLLGREGSKQIAATDGLPVLVLGPTGAGKTRHFIAPNIARWPGPVTATSVKTDLVDLTVAARRSKGRVYGFEPSGRLYEEMIAKGVTPVVWDPVRILAGGYSRGGIAEWKELQRTAIQARHTGDTKRWEQYMRLAATKRAATLKEDSDLLGQFLASQSSSHGGREQGLWAQQAGRTIADTLLVAVLAKRDLTDVLQWLLSLQVFAEKEYEPLSKQAKNWSVEGNNALVRLANKGSMDSKLSGSIDISVAEVVEALDWTAQRKDLNLLPTGVMLAPPDDRVDDADTLYLVADHLSQTTHKSLFAASLRHLFHVTETGEKNVTPSLFALDELANLAPLPDFPNIISTIRSSAQVLTGVQELSQMSANWGQDSAITVVGNHPTKVVLGGSADASAMRAWETLAVHRENKKKNDDEDQITASDFRTIPDGQAVVIARNADPFDVKLCDPQRWLQPAEPEPPQPEPSNTSEFPDDGENPPSDSGNKPDRPPSAPQPSNTSELLRAAALRASQPVISANRNTSDTVVEPTVQVNGEGVVKLSNFLNRQTQAKPTSNTDTDPPCDENPHHPNINPANDTTQPEVSLRGTQFLPPLPDSNHQPATIVPQREAPKSLTQPLRVNHLPEQKEPEADQTHTPASTPLTEWALTAPEDEAHVDVVPQMFGIDRGIFVGDGWQAGRDSLGDWSAGEIGFTVAAPTATSYETVPKLNIATPQPEGEPNG